MADIGDDEVVLTRADVILALCSALADFVHMCLCLLVEFARVQDKLVDLEA